MFGKKMANYQAWRQQQSGNPKYVLFAGVGFTLSFLIAYSQFYKPWAKKQRYAREEEYARIIYEQEKH